MTPERPRGSEKFKHSDEDTHTHKELHKVCVTESCNLTHQCSALMTLSRRWHSTNTDHSMSVLVCVDWYYLAFTQWRKEKGLKHLP